MTWASSSASSTRLPDRKSTRLNSSHTEIYTLSLHDALPIWVMICVLGVLMFQMSAKELAPADDVGVVFGIVNTPSRSEEHTSELQSHRDLHSFPTRRSSDLGDDLRARRLDVPDVCEGARAGR